MENLRKEIMEVCPDEFKGELADFINNIKSELLKIKIDIQELDELGNIGGVLDQVSDLAFKLYEL